MSRLRFLHIPKTAGSSFHECLFILHPGVYLRRQVFTFTGNIRRDHQHFESLSPRQRQRLGLFVGHAPLVTGFSEVDQLPTITILRQPVERVISLCQHVSEGKSPNWFSPGKDNAWDLDRFLRQGGARISNQQTRILLGRESYDLPPGTAADHADQAFEILSQRLAGFGLTENFDSHCCYSQSSWAGPARPCTDGATAVTPPPLSSWKTAMSTTFRS